MVWETEDSKNLHVHPMDVNKGGNAGGLGGRVGEIEGGKLGKL